MGVVVEWRWDPPITKSWRNTSDLGGVPLEMRSTRVDRATIFVSMSRSTLGDLVRGFLQVMELD